MRPANRRQRLFAGLMAAADDDSFELYGDRKQALLGPLRGTVVELGPGTGVNLRFLDPNIRWTGIEPNPAMHEHLRRRAAERGMTIEVCSAFLADSAIPDASVDAVISTLVLCSVPSVAAVLGDVMRVLRPGGRFVFIEHVRDRRRNCRQLIQKAAPWTPWRYFSDGCDPGRDIAADIHAAGFAKVDCEAYMQAGGGMIMAVNRPHIAGVAVK